MASLNSVTGSLSSTSSLRGYGGLSSGLDRDSLIESLTYGTRTKIENQKAKQDKLEWEQTAIRSIIDKVYNFSNTYNSYSSTTNIGSSSFFARNNVTTTGENSKYITATGTATSADLMSVVGVKQLAENAKLTGATASSAILATGTIDFNSKDIDVNNLNGATLEIKFGGETSSTTYDVKINMDLEAYNAAKASADGEYPKTDAQAKADVVAKAIETALKEHTTALGTTLDEHIKVTANEDGTISLTGDGDGNALSIAGGSAMEVLGLGEDEIDLDGKSMTVNTSGVVTKTTAAEYLPGKTMTFSYNGTNADITFSEDDKITNMATLQAVLQSKLDSAFGKGRIEVTASANGASGTLSFKTTTPDGQADKTSTLSIIGGDNGFFGETGMLKIDEGAANRVDLSKSLRECGLQNKNSIMPPWSPTLEINDVKIDITAEDTVQSIMDKINASDANVTISYQKNSDRFIISSNEKGASGEIKLEGTAANALFGAGTSGTAVQGKDAIIAVQYAGDSNVTEIVRDSNSFTMDGLTISVNGTFGYQEVKDDAGNVTGMERIEDTEAVTFNAKANVDDIVKGITDMVNAYNEIVALINSELKTKPDSDYRAALTASQKEDMSDEEIENYETKAKQGLLFGDNDLRNFATELRYVMTGSDIAAFAEIGITESSEYSDNGKLVIDEAKLRAALESDPDKVSALFTNKKDSNGTSGLMENISTVMNRYCNTIGATKGLLVTRAGSEHSPLSLLENTMKTEIDEIADYIETLLDRLESEEDRYIRQFTTLETLISEMNSQSSYLSSLSSGY